jgi:hypothetical protein
MAALNRRVKRHNGLFLWAVPVRCVGKYRPTLVRQSAHCVLCWLLGEIRVYRALTYPRIKAYNALAVTSLLYGSEIWALRQTDKNV